MFEHWYAVYPLKKNKGRARKNFKAALKNVSSFEVLLNGATRYAESVKAAATPKQFYIHPSNWLSGERWLDEDDIGDQPPQSLCGYCN